MSSQLVRRAQALTDFEKVRVEQIREIIAKQLEGELRSYWKIGELICEIYQHAERFVAEHGRAKALEQNMTGVQRVAIIAQELNLNPKVLMDAMRVVERWETEERFLEIAASSKQKMMTFGHMKELSRLADDSLAKHYAIEAAKQNWSVRELQLALKGLEGKAPLRGPGRKPKVPENLETCILSMQNALTAIKNKITTVWFGSEYDLLAELAEIDPKLFAEDPAFFDRIVEVHALAQEVSMLLSDAVERFSACIDELASAFNTSEQPEAIDTEFTIVESAEETDEDQYDEEQD